MDSPEMRKRQKAEYEHADISSEKLDAMSQPELTELLDAALESMTDETYDAEIINAYLEALDRKSRIPEYKSADEAFDDFQLRAKTALAETDGQDRGPSGGTRRIRQRRFAKTTLVAAVLISCLFCGMIAAQAMGVDVFGAVARWTESIFSYNSEIDGAANTPSESPELREDEEDIPEEYRDIYPLLEERGQARYVLDVPDGFELTDVWVDTSDEDYELAFDAVYVKDSDYLNYGIQQNSYDPTFIYEKSTEPVSKYERNGITHYIFKNNASIVAVWSIDDLEYRISSDSDAIDMKEIIDSFYEE